MNNLYSPGLLPGLDSRVSRVIQDLFDRVNYLTNELERVKERDHLIIPNGAARKENPQKGILEIPSPSGAGFVRVNEDGVIVSYSSPLFPQFPFVTSMWSNSTAATAVSNTTTETSLFTGATPSIGSMRTLEPGNGFRGEVYRVHLTGIVGTTGTPTIRLRLKLGSTTIDDSTAFNAPTNANGIFNIIYTVFIDNIGVGSSVRSQVEGMLTVASTGAVTPVFFVGFLGAVAVDLSVSQLIDVTAQWGTMSPSNTIQMLRGSIGKIRIG